MGLGELRDECGMAMGVMCGMMVEGAGDDKSRGADWSSISLSVRKTGSH